MFPEINKTYKQENGHVVEWINGTKEWWVEGKLHREDGPAVEFANGSKFWYKNGELHKLDGPAFSYFDGYTLFYIEGKEFSEQEYWKEIKQMNNPYRIPPVTGPSTRFEKVSAKLKFSFRHLLNVLDNWSDLIIPFGILILLISGFLGMVYLLEVVVSSSDPEKRWSIECPSREPWISSPGYIKDGIIHAHDIDGNPMMLSKDCMVTTIWLESDLKENE